ncbi:MAG: shikimate kinase [Acidimicrobiales bacterium]
MGPRSSSDGLTGNIVLTGFMGTGKTTIGRLLAERLNRTFVDTDQVIEERHGPIPRIFKDQGEAAFREMERALATNLSTAHDLVIATGGRLMLDQDARAALERSARVFCLAADIDVLVDRLASEADNRPLLDEDPETRIRELLEQRAAQYAAFEQVETSGRSPEEVVESILDAIADSG